MRRSGREESGEVAIPLLDSNEEHSNANGFVISTEDEDVHSDASEHPMPYSDDIIKSARTVRFDEHEQIIAPPLRSMTYSRETGISFYYFCGTFAKFVISASKNSI